MAEVNAEQAALWNTSGQGWARVQDTVGQILRPFEELLVEKAAERPRRRVLDVGCGTGGVTRAVAAATGAECVGVDIAESMVAAAREHGQAEFLLADAQTHVFEQRFDLVVSRFGVMFFADPGAAFTNLRTAVEPGGELCFITWRAQEENPFMLTGDRVAREILPGTPARDLDGPGPFSLADPARVREVLDGWADVEVTPIDRTTRLPEEVLLPYLTNMGPVSRALREVPERDRDRILDRVRGAFDEFVHDGEVSFPTATWRVTASAPL
ncbi:class I SAM-dependent methyltransferase [Lentzea chajnantorensis]